MSPSLLRSLLLATCLGTTSMAGAQDAAPANDEAQTQNGPVFPSILKEGARVVPTPQEQYEAAQQQYEAAKAKHEEAATQSVRAAANNLKRIALFAAEAIMALLVAGIVGGLFALLRMYWRQRRQQQREQQQKKS